MDDGLRITHERPSNGAWHFSRTCVVLLLKRTGRASVIMRAAMGLHVAMTGTDASLLIRRLMWTRANGLEGPMVVCMDQRSK